MTITVPNSPSLLQKIQYFTYIENNFFLYFGADIVETVFRNGFSLNLNLILLNLIEYYSFLLSEKRKLAFMDKLLDCSEDGEISDEDIVREIITITTAVIL